MRLQIIAIVFWCAAWGVHGAEELPGLTLGPDRTAKPADEGMVSVTPREFTGGIQNPLKGFRPDNQAGKPFCSVVRQYLKWNELEKCADDSLDRIIYVTNRKTEEQGKSYSDFNAKIVPRVYLAWSDGFDSNGKPQQYWPADLHATDYESPAFNQRMLALIEKLGRAWDDDPRIYAVQMGFIGLWGEQHTPNPTAEQRRELTAAFRKAFKHKPVMVRLPFPEFAEAGFGIYYDTFATLAREPETPNAPLEFPILASTRYPDLWKRAPIEGEVEYHWQNQRPEAKPEETFGRTPDETMTNPKYRRYMIGKIRRYHASYLGWLSDFDPKRPDVMEGASEIQKALGYRFVLERFRFTPRVAPDGSLAVNFVVRNTGSAPFYLDWPVAVALLDAKSHQPVWQTELRSVDVRQWLPGDHWNEEKSAYEIPAKSYELTERVSVPNTIPTGNYLLALSLLDRQGGLTPSARFACANYVTGGWHPLGVVGIGCLPARTEPDPALFASPAFDDTLAYKVPASLLAVKEPPTPAFKPVEPWTMDLSREILNPHRFWDVTSRNWKVDRRVTDDGPVPGAAGAKVITALGQFDSSSVMWCRLYNKAHLPPGSYLVSYQFKGTTGLKLRCVLVDGWATVAAGPDFVVSSTWQKQQFELKITGEFKDGAALRFLLPNGLQGEFSVTDYHMRKLD